MKYEHQAKFLKELRENHNLIQKDMAKLLGVGTQFVSNCERGIGPLPASRLKRFLKKAISNKDEADFISWSYVNAASSDLKDRLLKEMGLI